MTSFAEYAEELYPKDELLERLPEEAEREGLPRIHIPDEIGRLLQVLIVSSGAKAILELGALFGYSSIWMGRALPADGSILSLEASARHVEVSRRNLERAGLSGRAEVREGAALDLLQDLEGRTFDLVFIDADKPNYPNYLDWALRLTRPGSLIVGDNTWRHGEVVSDGDENAKAMADFNKRVAEDPRLISTIIPTREGGDAVTVAAVRATAEGDARV